MDDVTDRNRMLSGKVAIVTGAARGQGLAEATLFAAHGAKVVLTDVLADVHDAASAIGPSAIAVDHDVSDRASWDAVAAAAVQAFGGVDILVNNAGIYRNTPILDTDEALFRQVLEINLVGAWHGIQTIAPLIVQRGGGAIVNIASIAGIKAVPGGSAYMTSKFGLRGLTKAAAAELGRVGIRVNAILPGIIDTPMTVAALAARGEGIVDEIPLRTIGQPGDVAELALFLASDSARFITGADYVIDGGSTA